MQVAVQLTVVFNTCSTYDGILLRFLLQAGSAAVTIYYCCRYGTAVRTDYILLYFVPGTRVVDFTDS